MNDQETPQGSGMQEGSPSQPPESPPAAETGGTESPNRTLMIVLSYIWILFLVPLLVEKDDSEVQWHAKHGMVLTITEIALYIVLTALAVVPVLGCFLAILPLPIGLAFFVIRVIAIVKGVNGERFTIPVISQYADRF